VETVGQVVELPAWFVDLDADAVDPDRLEEVAPAVSIDPAAPGLDSAEGRDVRVVPGQVAEPWAVWSAVEVDSFDRGLLEVAAAEAELVSIVRAAPDLDSAEQQRGAQVASGLALKSWAVWFAAVEADAVDPALSQAAAATESFDRAASGLVSAEKEWDVLRGVSCQVAWFAALEADVFDPGLLEAAAEVVSEWFVQDAPGLVFAEERWVDRAAPVPVSFAQVFFLQAFALQAFFPLNPAAEAAL
jgi:hypothetical protein